MALCGFFCFNTLIQSKYRTLGSLFNLLYSVCSQQYYSVVHVLSSDVYSRIGHVCLLRYIAWRRSYQTSCWEPLKFIVLVTTLCWNTLCLKKGDNYLHCSDLSCVIFCSEDDAEVYLQAINDMYYSIQVLLPTKLLKRKNLPLHLSHSKANPGRLYLTSRNPGNTFSSGEMTF